MFTALKRGLGAGVFALGCLAATVTPVQAAEHGWRVAYTSPDFPRDGFNDIVATGPDTAWAVGTGPCCDEADPMLIRRWDGVQWQAVPPPEPPPGTRYPALVDVAASSDTDVWVFGLGTDTSRFASHWDGTTWQTTDFGPDIQINDAVVPAPDNAWFAGTSWNGTSEIPMVWRFDGRGWTSAPAPAYVERLSGRAADDVWALGRAVADDRPTSLHWNGRSWRQIKLPRPALEPGVFALPGDILALGHDNVWATMVLGKNEGVWPGSVLLHWNGKRWRQIDVAAPRDSLYRLAPDGRGGLWILSANVVVHPYLLHYSHGRVVSRQLAPAQPGTTPAIEELASVPGTASVWAAGTLNRDDTGEWAATIFRYDP